MVSKGTGEAGVAVAAAMFVVFSDSCSLQNCSGDTVRRYADEVLRRDVQLCRKVRFRCERQADVCGGCNVCDNHFLL